MRELTGKTAFITGGGSGIGLGIAKAFADSGMKVAIADIDTERIAIAERDLSEVTSDFISLQVDVTQIASIEAAAAKTESAFGPVHVLCNNAGIGGGGRVLDTPEDRWRRVHEVNFWGPLNGIRVFLPRMLKQGQEGHIVNTSSFSGIHGHHSQSAYGTSKFALVGLSEFLRNDLADENISVSVLCPHVVDTPIFYPDLALDDLDAIEARKKTMPWLEQLAVSPLTVGTQVIRGILTDELYIFCDGTDSREMLETRYKAMFSAMNRQFPTTEGNK
jgi:NAD(P)-dependent dehydrogenase (short-subunit alcohol dehydrogenase family)